MSDSTSNSNGNSEGDGGKKISHLIAREWRKLTPFLSLLDFAGRPETKAAWVVRVFAIAVGLWVLTRDVRAATAPLLSAKPLPEIPVEEIEDYKFRLPERTRREMFAELAAAELSERQRAISTNTWNGHAWSREDDRGHYERVAVRSVAAKYHVTITQTYLVLDEAIRNHWPAPNGEPLPGNTPKLSIRTTW